MLLNIGWGEGGGCFFSVLWDFYRHLWLLSNVIFGGFIVQQVLATLLLGAGGCIYIYFLLSYRLVPFILHMIVWKFTKLSHYWVTKFAHFVHVFFNYMCLLPSFINFITAAIFTLLISSFFTANFFIMAACCLKKLEWRSLKVTLKCSANRFYSKLLNTSFFRISYLKLS